MDMRREALASLRAHFEEIFQLLERDSGRLFTHLGVLPVPQHDAWRDVYFLELWNHALLHEAHEAFHTLSLYTPNDLLEHALELVVRDHVFAAVLPLMGCLERRDGYNKHDRLRLIQCGTGSCSECRSMRNSLLQFLDLHADWVLCRSKLREARVRKLWTMWQPQLALNPATDVVFARIKAKTKANWSRVLAVVTCVMLWKRWIARRLHPDSSFVLDVLATRWSAMSVTTWKPVVTGWGGEIMDADD